MVLWSLLAAPALARTIYVGPGVQPDYSTTLEGALAMAGADATIDRIELVAGAGWGGDGAAVQIHQFVQAITIDGLGSSSTLPLLTISDSVVTLANTNLAANPIASPAVLASGATTLVLDQTSGAGGLTGVTIDGGALTVIGGELTGYYNAAIRAVDADVTLDGAVAIHDNGSFGDGGG